MRSHLAGTVFCLAAAVMLTVPAAAAAGDRQAEYIQLRLLIGEQRFSEALDRCRIMIAKYPDYVYLYETMAEIALYAQDLKLAAKFFEERIEDGTSLELSYFGLGTVYFNMAAYREAALCFDRAIELGISAPECYRNFVYAYERLEGVDASIRFFNSLCHRDPKNPHLWYAVALAYWSKRDYPIVLKNLNEALSMNSAEPRYLQAKAAVLLLIGKGRAGAEMTSRLMSLAKQESDLIGIQFLSSYEVLRQDRESAPQLRNELAQQSLETARRFGQFRWIGWWYERLANIEYSCSMFSNSIRHSQIAFDASRRCTDNQLAVDALVRQVECFMELGRYDSAVECAYKEMDITKVEKDNARTARSLIDLAWIYHELGMDDIAMDYAIEALGISENTNATNELLMRIYAILGLIYEGEGNYESALANLEASDRLIPRGGYWTPHRAVSHGNIGRVFMKTGDLKAAKYHFSLEYSLSRTGSFDREEAYSLVNLADYYARVNCRDQAKRLYMKAYTLSVSSCQKPTVLGSAIGLARLASKAHNVSEAIKWFDEAFSVAESNDLMWQGSLVRGKKKVPSESDLREYIDLLLAVGRSGDAFTFCEKWKLSYQAADVPVSRILRLFRNLPDSTRRSLEVLSKQLEEDGRFLRKSWDPGISSGARYDLTSFSKIIRAKIRIQRLLRGMESQDSVAFRQLYPRAASLSEIQRNLHGPSHAIVEYLVGEESSLVFLIQMHTMQVLHLDIGRAELQALIERMANVFNGNGESSHSWSANFANFDPRVSSEAYSKILEPILRLVPNAEELTIIPDGVLTGLPFECLVIEEVPGISFPKGGFVVEKFAVNYSSTATALIMRCHNGYRASETLLAIGNPETGAAQGEASEGVYFPSGLARPAPGFPRLPGAEKEVRAILHEFNDEGRVLLNRNASKSMLESLISSYAIVHIAAHTSIYQESPSSSAIFLAVESENGRPTILRASELSNLDINAQLVVLSSCNTLRYSEGVETGGFVAALTSAGVPSVIGSLWSADDYSTALLMTRFYHYLSCGESTVKALQKAKMDLICSGRSDPFYWAPFILVGIGSRIELPPSHTQNSGSWLFAGTMAGLVSIVLLIFWVRRASPQTFAG